MESGSNMQSGGLDPQANEKLLKKERVSNNAWNKFIRNRAALTGFIIVSAMILLAVLAPVISPYDPNALSLGETLLKPGSSGHIFGTDEFGRDLLSRILYGARMSVLVAFGSTLVGGVVGIVLGLIAGYMGGVVDAIFMRIVDGMFAFPFILLSIFMVTILGSGVFNVILAIGVSTIPRFARVVRGEVMILKHEEYCNVERLLGASNLRIIFHHILPNALSPIIVYATLNFASAIISEASLSFLGLGIAAPTSSWGSILRAGKSCMSTAPHIATIAGVFILITVIGFNLVGDGIRDIMDPKMKR